MKYEIKIKSTLCRDMEMDGILIDIQIIQDVYWKVFCIIFLQIYKKERSLNSIVIHARVSLSII